MKGEIIISILRQKYHLEPEFGLMNDPNGLVYFNDEYHVFFQWNKFEKNHSHKEWGHYVSQNLTDWTFLGSAIEPEKSYDIDGVYSGSAMVINGILHLYYTGNSKVNGKRKSTQCYVTSMNGRDFKKRGIFLETPKNYTEHFRDPKISKINQYYWMLIGAQSIDGTGEIAIAASTDAVNWEFKKSILRMNDYEMIECPDLFRLEEKDVLIYCPQARDNNADKDLYSFAVYNVGKFDEMKVSFENIYDNYKLLDYGFDFYAPQTFLDGENRRILIGWMSNMNAEETLRVANDSNSVHCLTMPRELSVKNNLLNQKPIKEMYNKLYDYSEVNCKYKGYIVIENINYMYFNKIDDNLQVSFFNSDFIFSYENNKNMITIKRKNWVSNQYESKKVVIDSIFNIEFWIDSTSVEIFINDGQYTLTSWIYNTVMHNLIVAKSENISFITYKIKENKNE